ncbi:MAG: hypothetical protein DWQ19_09655 [Crenarchaeota archaeon]|nr:MAG: hypothetical protein DWQ19_09655 [Thermoproteota archaeon]
MSIGLDELTVLQDSLRHFSQMDGMVDFVSRGNFWTQDKLNDFATERGLLRCPLIEIASFPDGRLMLHDGHHRAVATNLAGRDFFRSSEFVLKHWDYENYLNVNFDNKWVTPLNIKSEIRVADIGDFKKQALDVLANNGEEEAYKFIRENKKLYAKPRTISSIIELTDRYLMDRSEFHEYRCNDYCWSSKEVSAI